LRDEFASLEAASRDEATRFDAEPEEPELTVFPEVFSFTRYMDELVRPVSVIVVVDPSNGTLVTTADEVSVKLTPESSSAVRISHPVETRAEISTNETKIAWQCNEYRFIPPLYPISPPAAIENERIYNTRETAKGGAQRMNTMQRMKIKK
jgi:hypothetical protein